MPATRSARSSSPSPRAWCACRAHNAEQEEAVEEIEIAYDGQPLEIGFNVGYLLDVLGALTNEVVHLSLKDGNAAALITVPEDEGFEYMTS